MTESYDLEQKISELAVQKAVIVTEKILNQMEKGELSKGDKTSVSLADFAAQALLVAAIHHNFPGDSIVGEEDTTLLRQNPKMANQVWELVSSTHLEDEECERLLQSPASPADMFHFIDLGGTSYGGPKGRVWMIDPVDGTKGYLTGENGRISEKDTDTTGAGYMISVVRGEGAQIRPLSAGALLEAQKIEKRDTVDDLSKIRFAENCNPTWPQFPDRYKIAEKLGALWDPIHIYSTQLRYIALTLGTCDVVLRATKPSDPPAHIWDHAGGVMLFEEAGGKITDLNGKDLDFTAGRDLTENFGLIAAMKGIHRRVVEATKEILLSYPEYADVIDSGL